MARHAVVVVSLAVVLSIIASGSAAASATSSGAADTLAFVSAGTLSLTQSGLVQRPLRRARGVSGFAWSPDGRRIVYSNSNGGLHVIDADGSNARPLGESAFGRVTWAPDGKRIAFAAFGTTGTRVYTRTLAGVKAKVLATGVPSPVHPAWSPRGTSIAFMSASIDHAHIYTVRPDGSGRRRLTNGREESFPLWSPDGALLMYQPYICRSGTCGYGIAVMRPDGTRQRLLAHVASSPGAGGLHAAWSPDGRRIAFLRLGRAIGSDILVVDVDGGPMRRVATDSRSSSVPAWSPDSRRIAYASGSGITLMNADGSGKRPFVAFGDSPAWQPRR